MGTMAEREQMIAEASLFEAVIGVLINRIGRLPNEQKEELSELVAELGKASGREDVEEIKNTMKEILLPQTVGKLLMGAPPALRSEFLGARSTYIGEKIRKCRGKRDLTQEALARKAGLPQSHISRLEAGKHSPSSVTLQKIAKALRVKMTELDYEEHE